MIFYLNKIRTPSILPLSKKLLYSASILILGILFGIIAKALDETASNILPQFLEVLDLRNFFSRMGIWIFLAVIISIYSRTPYRAALNVLFFFIGMVGSYYLYTVFIAGFFPKTYMMIWIVMTVISPIMAFVCWYAKGDGIVAVIIASLILAFMTRQAISFGFWYFHIKHSLEVFLWVLIIVFLYKTPRQILIVFSLGTIMFLILSPMNMLFGML